MLSRFELVKTANELVSEKAKPNFRILGPKVGKLMGKIGPVIESDFTEEQY